MQVIAGTHRGRKLKTLKGDLTRPTSGLVRGAMFSILGDRLYEARVLDLYAGSGALAIEALSRGAKEAVLVERAADAQTVIQDNLTALKVGDRATLVRGDVFAKLKTLQGPFDVVLADPPYRTVDWTQFLQALQLPGLLSPQATVLIEHARGEDVPAEAGHLKLARAYQYGETHLALYHRSEPGTEP